jgi:hypothetical protein
MIAELSCWELLSVVLDEGNQFSSGPEATALLRDTYDPLE